MSRKTGLIPFPLNYEVTFAEPLDSRAVAQVVDNLIDTDYWRAPDGKTYLYRGMMVSVWNDTEENNGVYLLLDNDYQNIDNWLRVSGVIDNSITSSNLKIEEGFGPTAGYILSIDENGGLRWIEKSPAEIDTGDLNIIDGFGPTSGYILSTDGDGGFKWVPKPEAPVLLSDLSILDGFGPTSGYILSTDGDGFKWVPKPEAPVIPSDLAIVDGFGPTSGYILSTDGEGGFKWVEREMDITVSDFSTGLTFSSVRNFIFRGGSVNVPSGVSTGTQITGESDTVTIWIPSPSYSPPFNIDLSIQSVPRYISLPDDNINLGTNPGQFSIGNWPVQSDYNNSISRQTINPNIISFTTAEYFSLYGAAADGIGTTISFYAYGGNSEIIGGIDNFVVTGGNSQVVNGIGLVVNEFLDDADRKKAKITAYIDLATFMPNGGIISYAITHYGGLANGQPISFTSSVYFFDSPPNQGLTGSTSNIGGSVVFDEKLAINRYFSGVAYYNTPSVFSATISSINMLNQLTLPLDKQIQIDTENMAVDSTLGTNLNSMRGFANGLKGPAAITGWSLNWNSTGLTFSSDITVNVGNTRIPGFIGSSNDVVPVDSGIDVFLYDYGISDSKSSLKKNMLFDTAAANAGTHNNNPIMGETNRLSVTGILTGGSISFNSNGPLANDELQYIFGRIIYPTGDFRGFYPSVNFSALINYTNSGGSNKTFNPYTSLNTGTTESKSLNNYRWYVASPFGKDSLYSTDFTNGIFTFNSNFSENDIEYKQTENSNGTGDLAIILGIDPVNNGSYPTGFIYLTGDYPGRTLSPIYNLDDTSKRIAFTTGQIQGVRKVWVFIGYKNSARGKEFILSNIEFE
jgi:hypothetical protein